MGWSMERGRLPRKTSRLRRIEKKDEFLKPIIANGDAGHIKGMIFLWKLSDGYSLVTLKMATPFATSAIAPTVYT